MQNLAIVNDEFNVRIASPCSNNLVDYYKGGVTSAEYSSLYIRIVRKMHIPRL